MKYFFLFLIFLLIASCGQDKENEHYDAIDITLTEANHPHGYGEKDCFYCHIKGNIHQVSTTNISLRETALRRVEEDGINSCSECHGQNGVSN